MGKGERNKEQRRSQGGASNSSHLPQTLNADEEEVLAELEANVPAVRNMKPDQRTKLVRSISIISSHSGPLPAPEDLRQYAEQIPNGGERIMALTENQAAHRMEVEKNIMVLGPKETARGQLYALIIGLAGLSTAGYIASLGMAGTSGLIGTGALCTLAVGFLGNRKK